MSVRQSQQLSLAWRRDGSPVRWARDRIEAAMRPDRGKSERLFYRRGPGNWVDGTRNAGEDFVKMGMPGGRVESDAHTHPCPWRVVDRSGHGLLSVKDLDMWVGGIADGWWDVKWRHIISTDRKGNAIGYATYMATKRLLAIAREEGHYYIRRKYEEMGSPPEGEFVDNLLECGLLQCRLTAMPGYRFDEEKMRFVQG